MAQSIKHFGPVRPVFLTSLILRPIYRLSNISRPPNELQFFLKMRKLTFLFLIDKNKFLMLNNFSTVTMSGNIYSLFKTIT